MDGRRGKKEVFVVVFVFNLQKDCGCQLISFGVVKYAGSVQVSDYIQFIYIVVTLFKYSMSIVKFERIRSFHVNKIV